jgi:hypothetical protein
MDCVAQLPELCKRLLVERFTNITFLDVGVFCIPFLRDELLSLAKMYAAIQYFSIVDIGIRVYCEVFDVEYGHVENRTRYCWRLLLVLENNYYYSTVNYM